VKATRQCSVEDCDRKHEARGFCHMHFTRLRVRGTIHLPQGPSVADRLAARLERKPNGCLEWTGFTDDRGYGRIWVDGKCQKAHRIAWELANGLIPDGMCVCHRCDNPPCCDVEKCLFLGTQVENIADMDAKGRRRPRGKNKPKVRPRRRLTNKETL
jgi:hypothetical protein